MREADTQTVIRNTLSRGPVRLFRNNSGVAVYADGSSVVYGLCTGSSDLIGWTSIQITPEHVGQTLAVFTAIEVKSAKGRSTPQQTNFLEAVRSAGGYAGVARALEDARKIISGR